MVQDVSPDIRRGVSPPHENDPVGPKESSPQRHGGVVPEAQGRPPVRRLRRLFPSSSDDVGPPAGSGEGCGRQLTSQPAFETSHPRRDLEMRTRLCQLPCCANIQEKSGCSSAWLERRVWDAEAAGSNPAIPTEDYGGPSEILARRVRIGTYLVPPSSFSSVSQSAPKTWFSLRSAAPGRKGGEELR